MSIKVDAREKGAVMGDEVVMQMEGDSIGKKTRSLLFDLVSLLAQKPNPPTSSTTPLFKGGKGGSKRVGRQVFGLALLIAVVLVSESVAATPKPFSPPEPNYIVQGKRQKAKGKRLFPFSLSLFPSDEATRTAAEQAFQEAYQLYRLGTAESLRQAITKLEEALPLFQMVGDRAKEATVVYNIGRVYDDLGEKPKALEFYNQCLPLYRAVGDKAGEASTLHSIGSIYDDLGEKQKALEFYNQSLPLFRALSDKSWEARTLHEIGFIYDGLGEKQKALEFYNQSLPLFQSLDSKTWEAFTLERIGHVYDNLGEKQKALEFYNQSLLLYHVLSDKVGEASTLNSIGSVYDNLGEKQKALEFYNQSLPLFQSLDDKQWEAITLNSIGSVYDNLGEKQKALEFYNQSLPLFQSLDDKQWEAITLNNIGSVYDNLGEKKRAFEFLDQSLSLYRTTGDKNGEALVLLSIGRIYQKLGEIQKALEFYNQSLSLRRAVGDKAGEAITLNNIGRVYQDLGEKQKALELFYQSLLLFRVVGNKEMEAGTLNNIGGVYNDLGEKQKALEFYNQSLPLRRIVGDKTGEAATLSNIGSVYNAFGEKPKALELFNQSLSLSRAVDDKAGEAVTLNNIGGVYNDLGEKPKALELFNQSLSLSRVVGNKAEQANTLHNIAYIERSQGNLNSALTQIEAAINIIEDLRTKIGSQELRASYFATVQGYYQFYIDLLMQLHKTNPSKGYNALALHASERARARSLLELLTEANANIRSGVNPKLLEQERTLQQQLSAAEYDREKLLKGQYTDKQLNEIKQQIATLLTQLQQLEGQIRVNSPRYAALKYPQPLNLQQIQSSVLDDNTILLEYSLGKERSYLWAVTKTSITSYSLPPRAEIEAAAQEFYKQLKSETGNIEEGMKLSQMILAPVMNQLGNKRLLIVGDGALQSIPFAALPIPEKSGVRSQESGVRSQELGVRSQVSVFPASRPEINLRANSSSRLKTTKTLINSPLKRTLAMSQGFKPLADANPYTPLLVNHEIVSLPSASTIAVLRNELINRKPAPKTLVAIADPVFEPNDPRFKTSQPQQNPPSSPSEVKRSAIEIGVNLQRLEFTRKEAEAILNLVPANQRFSAFDFAANRTTATQPDLSQYRIIHLATHGLLNTVNPELSGVVLSLFDEKGADTNGFLRLNDIFNLNLPAELVVLSACQTGLGKDVKGEGLVGLTRGFMYAGAKRVTVSLWSVNDTATSSLMTKYYQKMLNEGLNPVAALRAAQLEMMKTEQWKAPYYWAAFVVQGEWK